MPQVSREHRLVWQAGNRSSVRHGPRALLSTMPSETPRVSGLREYLTDVDRFITAARLHQEFVGKDSIIGSIFVIVWHDFPSFPVTVECILKS